MSHLFLSTVINGSSSSASATTQVTGEQVTTAVSTTSNFTVVIVYFIVLIALYYFLGIRPQRKRQKDLENLLSTVNAGDWVVLDSGLYGKVTDISEQVFMIEFGMNKGVIIPVIKNRVIGKADPTIINS